MQDGSCSDTITLSAPMALTQKVSITPLGNTTLPALVGVVVLWGPGLTDMVSVYSPSSLILKLY